MHDEIRRKIEKRLGEPSAPGARLPGWVSAALLSAGLVLPTLGCWNQEGSTVVYAGPPAREPQTQPQPQPPPDEPADKKGEVSDPEPETEPETEMHTLYGI